jgi:hypothetical protein
MMVLILIAMECAGTACAPTLRQVIIVQGGTVQGVCMECS